MVSVELQRRSPIGLRRPSLGNSVGAGSREHDSIFRFGAYEIDLVQQELRRDGAVVAIEPQVFDVLVYLVQHRDRVVSKDELLESVWQGRIVSDAALNSRISAARRAVGDDGTAQALIRTVHKLGFRFVHEVSIDDFGASTETKE